MSVTTDFPYPKSGYVQLLKDFYAGINGPESLQPLKTWQAASWEAQVNCSRGAVLEKAGFSFVNVAEGSLNGNPGSIRLFETLAYPANHAAPGFIIMTNMNRTQELGTMIVLFTDLILQGGPLLQQDAGQFSGVLQQACAEHGHSYAQHNAFYRGQGLLGGSAGECGMLGFFEEKDLPLLEAVITGLLPAYGRILEQAAQRAPGPETAAAVDRSRARLVEWIILENYGIKIARENGIPLEVIEAYGFPPAVRY